MIGEINEFKFVGHGSEIYALDAKIDILKISKKELWKYEKAVFSLTVNVQKGGYFYIPRSFIRKNNIDKNYVVLYRFAKNRQLYSINKISRVRKNDYVLTIHKNAFRRLKIRTPNRVNIEIIQIKKLEKIKNNIVISKNIDLTMFLPKNSTYFKRPGNWISVYYINKSKTSIITVPRYLKLDDFSLWNLGFYLAEGFKGKYRFALGNNEPYLLKRFMKFGEKYFGLNKNEWYLEIRVKKIKPGIMNFWSNKLKICSKQIRVRKQRIRPPNPDNGSAYLVIYNIILSNIINKIIYETKFYNFIDVDKRLKLAMIRGLEAGDGTVMHHNKSIEMGITCTSEELEIIKSLYSGLLSKDPFIKEYHTSKNVWFVYHRGTKMATEYILDDHFKEHQKRREKLIKLYLEKIRNQIKYFKSIKSGIRNIRDISNHNKITYHAAKFIINRFVEHGLLEHKKIFVRKNNRLYKTREFYFTEKGKNLINNINI